VSVYRRGERIAPPEEVEFVIVSGGTGVTATEVTIDGLSSPDLGGGTFAVANSRWQETADDNDNFLTVEG
jgi:hypothetical protein